MFREDGTGHVWWHVSGEDGRFGNEEEFVWEVVDRKLVVNDLPPAVVDVYSDDNFLLHPIDETVEPERGVLAGRCDLEIPEGLRVSIGKDSAQSTIPSEKGTLPNTRANRHGVRIRTADYRRW
jgi:hypothetical protein